MAIKAVSHAMMHRAVAHLADVMGPEISWCERMYGGAGAMVSKLHTDAHMNPSLYTCTPIYNLHVISKESNSWYLSLSLSLSHTHTHTHTHTHNIPPPTLCQKEVKGVTSSYLTVFNLEGEILIDPPMVLVSEVYKYEGLDFLTAVVPLQRRQQVGLQRRDQSV